MGPRIRLHHEIVRVQVCVVAARLAWARRARGVEAALDPLQQRAPPAAGAAPEDLGEARIFVTSQLRYLLTDLDYFIFIRRDILSDRSHRRSVR